MPDVDVDLILHHLMWLVIAYALAVPIAWERESRQGERGAGLRTFPLVAIASCGFVLIGRSALADDAGSMARVLVGLMTGIGFIGGGAVLKTKSRVKGTATAASLWTTGAVGGAVGFQRLEIAIVLSLATFATLRLLRPLKDDIRDEDDAADSDDD